MQSNPQQEQGPYLNQQASQHQVPLMPSQFIPKKPRQKNLGWIVALIVVFFIGIAIGHSGTSTNTDTSTNIANTNNSTNTQADRTTAPVLAWKTTHTYNGNGAKKTETITVPSDWKIQWKCDPASFGGSYNMIVAVDNSDGTSADPAAINSMCQSGSVSGETEERTSGNVYLDVNSEGSWTIIIQELK